MHRWRWRALAAGVAGVTLFAASPPAPGHAAPREQTPAAKPAVAKPPAAKPVTVTLITGDRVTVRGGDAVAVQAGPGRSAVRFTRRAAGGHTYVVPADAQRLLRAGTLDRRLFDVTLLAAQGHTGTADLPLIVAYPQAGRGATARGRAAAGGATVVRELPAVGALSVRVGPDARDGLWTSLTSGDVSARSLRSGVTRIWLNGRRTLDLDHSVPQIGAPAAWRAGLDGAGVTVGVIDTGIDAAHPDLAGQVTAAHNFTEDTTTGDDVGHGTHVASTIAGTGKASGDRYRGVAPGAKLLDAKVRDLGGCMEDAIIAGMEWVAQQGARVANMSLGGGDAPEEDPLEEAVDRLTAERGTLFVLSAGNSGPAAGTIGSPGSADAALTVGAVDRADQVAEFSSRGPRVGDDGLKPDITAPGVDIVAARSSGDQIGGPAPVEGYSTLSGTSMAAPHVTGAAAILTQQHPGWTPAQRKDALMASAQPVEGAGVFEQGAGRVDVARGIAQTVTTTPASISFGRQLWPHGDDKPLTRAVTYRNGGAAAVTLTLAVQTDAGVPPAAFTPAARTVTVPAGGTATVDLTADTSVAGEDGTWGGRVVATGPGGVRAVTPFGVHREVESYDVTFIHIGRDGRPASDYATSVVDLSAFGGADPYHPSGTATVRLPKGTYGMYSWLHTGIDTEDDPIDDTVTMLVQPTLRVTRDARVVLDARTAKPVRVTVPRRGATAALAAVNADWTGENWSVGASALADSFDGLFAGPVGPATTTPGFASSVNAAFGRRNADPARWFHGSPYWYDLAWQQPGRMMNGLRRDVRSRGLATVEARYDKQAEGVQGIRLTFPGFAGEGSGGWAMAATFDLPFARTEYVNTDGGVRWSASFEEQLPAQGEDWPETVAGADGPPMAYRAGRTYREAWNRAVFGPAVTHPPVPDAWASRTGDQILAAVPMAGDGDGRVGWSTATGSRVALYRDGTLVAESGDGYVEAEVPAGAAAYRLESAQERGAPHTLSTSVSAVWTFRSAHADGTEPVRLPLSSVRFTPPVDRTNTARPGTPGLVDVHVERQPGSAAARSRSLTVEVSYDDGKTWRRVALLGSGGHRVAVVAHPDRAGFASLRATATDAAGDTVTQTVIRVYRIG